MEGVGVSTMGAWARWTPSRGGNGSFAYLPICWRAVPGVLFPARHDRPRLWSGVDGGPLEFAGRQKGPQSAFYE